MSAPGLLVVGGGPAGAQRGRGLPRRRRRRAPSCSSRPRAARRTSARRCRRSCCAARLEPDGLPLADAGVVRRARHRGARRPRRGARPRRRAASRSTTASEHRVRRRASSPPAPSPSRPPVDGRRPRRRAPAPHASRTRSRCGCRAAPGTRAVVVGSGFIGCEAAASLRVRGCDVALLSMEPAPQTARLGPEVGARLAGWLEEAGVDARYDASVEAITAIDDGRLRVAASPTATRSTPTSCSSPPASGRAATSPATPASSCRRRAARSSPDARCVPRRRGVLACGDCAAPRHARRRPPAARRALGRRARPGRGRGHDRRRRRGGVDDRPRLLVDDRRADAEVRGLGRRLRRGPRPRARRRRVHRVVRRRRRCVGVLAHDRDEDYERRARPDRARSADPVSALEAVVVVPARDEAAAHRPLPGGARRPARHRARRLRRRGRPRPLHRRHARARPRPPRPRIDAAVRHRRCARGRRRRRAPARHGPGLRAPARGRQPRRPDRQHRRRHGRRARLARRAARARRRGAPRRSAARSSSPATRRAALAPGDARPPRRARPSAPRRRPGPRPRRRAPLLLGRVDGRDRRAPTARSAASSRSPRSRTRRFEAPPATGPACPITRSAAVRVATAARTDGRASRGLARDLELGEWLARRRYDGCAYRAGRAPRAQGRDDDLGRPARPATARRRSSGVLATAVLPFAEAGLVDQVLVVDGASRDATAARAARAGAEVHAEDDLLAEFGPALGKGDAMWRALSVAHGDIVVYMDADTDDPAPGAPARPARPAARRPGRPARQGARSRDRSGRADGVLEPRGRPRHGADGPPAAEPPLPGARGLRAAARRGDRRAARPARRAPVRRRLRRRDRAC